MLAFYCEELLAPHPTPKLEDHRNQFPKYHMKILLGNFDAKLEREDISN
jgi:hypothetical protein